MVTKPVRDTGRYCGRRSCYLFFDVRLIERIRVYLCQCLRNQVCTIKTVGVQCGVRCVPLLEPKGINFSRGRFGDVSGLARHFEGHVVVQTVIHRLRGTMLGGRIRSAMA